MKITELRKNSCRFIEGEASYDSDYCGRECVPSQPWCIQHLRMVSPKAETIIRRELAKWEDERAGKTRAIRVPEKLTDEEVELEDGDVTPDLIEELV